LELLPVEIKCGIFNHLSLKDQCSTGTTCRNLSLSYDFIIENNQIYKDKRDLKRFKYYLEKNFNYQTIIPDFKDTAFDFNVFTYIQPQKILIREWKSAAYKIFVDGIMIWQLTKIPSMKYPCLFSLGINFFEILYKRLIKEQIEDKVYAPEIFLKSINQIKEKNTFLFWKIDRIDYLSLSFLLKHLVLPALPCLFIGNLYALNRFIFLFSAQFFFFEIFKEFFYFNNRWDSSNGQCFKTGDFIIAQDKDSFSKTTVFYPYTVEGARFITKKKRIDIIFFLLKTISFLYTFYNFYLRCIDIKIVESLVLQRKKAAGILKKMIFNCQKHQTIKEILQSNTGYIFCYDSFLKFLLNH